MTLLASQKIWRIKTAEPALQMQLSRRLNISPVVAQLLINRKVKDVFTAEQFLTASLDQLYDPFLLKDMDKAVARVLKALRDKERVLIFGDYDVDGITSIAILQMTLEEMGLEVFSHIPHRVDDGYGLNNMVVKIAKQKEATLFIAVDCGITSTHEVDLLNKARIDTIIVDHHEPALEGLPPALAVIDPKRADDPYPFKELAAVGLVLKFIQALTGKVKEDVLDFVALGTVADVVALVSENRILVKHGLEKIKKTKNPGLCALMDAAKIKPAAISPHAIGFILGPRLNATGRIDSARKSLELLLCDNEILAAQLAQTLNQFNNDRQKLQRQMLEDAINLIEQEINFKDEKVIVVSKEGWHRGVLGIVASRVCEMYARPAVVISLEDGIGSASARSITGFHLSDALNHCSAILEDFGGHKLAAGLTIRQENIRRFKEDINGFANQILKIQDLIPGIDIDSELPLSALSRELVDEIDKLEPFGAGNPVPLFATRNVKVKGKPILRAKDTVKFWVTDGQLTVSVIGFGMAKYSEFLIPGQEIDIVYQLAQDTWDKFPILQLKLKDIKTSER